MKKLQSINRLHEAGFNTPKLIFWSSPYTKLESNLKFWMDTETKPGARVSIRTESIANPEQTSCPHHPNILRPLANRYVKKHLKDGYEVYVFEGINPLNCVRRGNLIVDYTKVITVEYLEGPGTVRDLEKSIVIHKQFDDILELKMDSPLGFLYESIKRNFFGLEGQILEWSLYKEPVGRLNMEDIYWELRKWQ